MAFQGNSENENSWIKEIYKKLNEDWRIIMQDAHENPKIMYQCQKENFLPTLKDINSRFEQL